MNINNANNEKDNSISSAYDCPICLRQYVDPMILNCGHTFCASCIDKIQSKFYIKIICPLCRKDTLRSDIKVNFAVKQIIEEKIKYLTQKRPSKPGVYLDIGPKPNVNHLKQQQQETKESPYHPFDVQKRTNENNSNPLKNSASLSNVNSIQSTTKNYTNINTLKNQFMMNDKPDLTKNLVELDFDERFSFRTDLPNPIPFEEVKDKYYPSTAKV